MSRYDHTQYSPINVILYALAAWFAFWFFRVGPGISWLMLLLAALMLFFALSFQFMRVRDAGEFLSVRFGPLPVFGTKIPYDSIKSVAASRSSFMDGWGVHYIPRKGWTFNVYGFDCVRIELDGKSVRVGSNEPQRLIGFVVSRLAQN